MARGPSGRVVVANADDGTIVSEAPFDSMSDPELELVDVAFDQWQKRLITYEAQSADDGGEITTYALLDADSGVAIGPRAHRAWVDGIARLWPAPHGIVVFEDGFGPRWKVLWNDAAPSPSVAAPRPASVWTTVLGDVCVVHALVAHDASGGFDLAHASSMVHPGTVGAPLFESLGIRSGTIPVTTRLARLPWLDRGMLVDIVDGEPVARLWDGSSLGQPMSVGIDASHARIEQALAWSDDIGSERLTEGGFMAWLLSGSVSADAPDHSRLIVSAIDSFGQLGDSAVLELPGQVRVEEQFFSRDLVLAGPMHLIAATSTGLVSVHVGKIGDAIVLEADPDFAGSELRGPVAAVSGI